MRNGLESVFPPEAPIRKKAENLLCDDGTSLKTKVCSADRNLLCSPGRGENVVRTLEMAEPLDQITLAAAAGGCGLRRTSAAGRAGC